ncbi:MAG: Ig-like domain-containing protein [Spirochaetales bacterium]|nr:Ig-like domain-containing protein [Spirochaetales bacterium]
MNKNHHKKSAVILPLFFAVLLPLFAGGNAEEYAFEPVDGDSHWSFSINLDELEEGKHNLIVRSEDEAGNVRLEGPFDFTVDPQTDVPLLAIAHPKPHAHVGRRLPIIGTALDDDGVSRVEVRVDEGQWHEASGKTSWSIVLDVEAFGDGAHVLEARSFDINGIESDVIQLPFIVDMGAPRGGIESPVSGTVISGKSVFKGQFEDSNGMASLELSQDGGEEWIPLSFRKKSSPTQVSFSLPVDSRKIEDGPVVWWFRSTDSQGLQSQVPFLFFVDNGGPLLELDFPIKEEKSYSPVPGNVFLSGHVSDPSGVESLQILLPKEAPLEVPLRRGDSRWTFDLILPGNASQIDVRIQAKDGAGNITEIKPRIPVDREADRPIVEWDGGDELPQRVKTQSFVLTGSFQDDDGEGTLLWTYGEETGRIDDVGGLWTLNVPAGRAGESVLTIQGEDSHGILGEKIMIPLLRVPPPSYITLHSVSFAGFEESEPWKPGMVFPMNGGEITGSVISSVNRGLTLLCLGEDGSEQRLSLKSLVEDPTHHGFTLRIPKSKEARVWRFELQGTDGFQPLIPLATGIFQEGAPDETGLLTNPRQYSDAIEIALPSDSGVFPLVLGAELEGWTRDSALGAVLVPETPIARLRAEGSSLKIEAGEMGTSPPLALVLPDGSRSKTFQVQTDFTPPVLLLDEPIPEWVRETLTVKGTVQDEGGVAKLTWKFQDQAPQEISLEEDGDQRIFSFELNPEYQSDASGLLVIQAFDDSGNHSEHIAPLTIDTTVPEPIKEAMTPTTMGARATLLYQWKNQEWPAELYVEDSQENIIAQASLKSQYWVLPLEIGAESGELSLVAEDEAGNRFKEPLNLEYNAQIDAPHTVIQTPVPGSVVRGPVDLAGLVMDDDTVAQVRWRVDGGYWRELPGGSSFRVPLPLGELEDGTHRLEVEAEDAVGNISAPSLVVFQLSRKEAHVEILEPVVGLPARHATRISGIAQDENGIQSVLLSFDHGQTFVAAQADGMVSADDIHSLSNLTSENFPERNSSETPSQQESEEEAGESLDAEGDSTQRLSQDKDSDSLQNLDSLFNNQQKPVEWFYVLDTSVLEDGVHSLLVKVVDGAGDEALLAGILDVDNQAPRLQLSQPPEGLEVAGSMVLEGRLVEPGGLASFHYVLERDGTTLVEGVLSEKGVFHKKLELPVLESGPVLLRMEAVDQAGNSTAVTRSLLIGSGTRVVQPFLTLPLEGGEEGPYFHLAGHVEGVQASDTLLLVVDGKDYGPLEFGDEGLFERLFSPGELPAGNRSIRVDVLAGSDRIQGKERQFTLKEEGPWVLINSLPPFSAVGEYPQITGQCGYWLEDENHSVDQNEPSQEPSSQRSNKIKAPKALSIELSFDGGLTFKRAGGKEDWKYLLDTSDLSDGTLSLLVRAGFQNDEWAYARTILRLDKTPPELSLDESPADGRFNGELLISGQSEDDRALKDVSVSVRPGSSGRYEVPSFVQGMYLDVAALGATWVNAGLGLTFFDDNVKLQVSAGWAPDHVTVKGKTLPARVSGAAVGATLLANMVYLPLGYWWGPSWEPISLSLAIGANFTYFTSLGSAGGGVMSAVVLQTEIPKITFANRRFLTYLAPYLEGRMWFFSSDVNTEPAFTFSVGLRLGLL